MAANGFIELLRLAKRGNKNYVSTENEVNRWSGIAFEMMGQYFVAPLGEVSEVGGVSKSMLKQSRLNFDKIEKCE